MNIYLEVEVYNREFKARMLLGCYAALKGFDIYLMHRSEIHYLGINNMISPGIIFMKDANSTNEISNNIYELKKKGFVITSQDEESGIAFDDYNDFIKRRFPNENTFEYLEYFFCWGKRDQTELEKKFKNKTQYINSGSPRIDLLSNKFYDIDDKKKIHDKYNVKNFILIPTNISFPIGLRRIADAYEGFASEKKNLEWSEEYFFTKNIQQLTLLKYFVDLIRLLVRGQKKYDIILRPHPNEKIEDWEKFISIRQKNFKIIKDGYLSDFIFASEAVIHNGCTSSIEAKLMNKRIISFEPVKFIKNYDKIFTNSLGKICINKESVLEEVINLDSAQKISNPINQKILDELNFRINYSTSAIGCQNIVELFKKIREKNNLEVNFFKIKKINILKKIKNILKVTIHNIFNLSIDRSVFEQKFPPIKNSTMLSYLESFSKFDKEISKVNFQKISSRIIKIKKI
jgi:surface carbohydrate biosynthesis protein